MNRVLANELPLGVVHPLSEAMFRLVALSLGLDRTYFDSFAADPDGLYLFFLSKPAYI